MRQRNSSLYKALSRLRTKRRVVLTGYPLQVVVVGGHAVIMMVGALATQTQTLKANPTPAPGSNTVSHQNHLDEYWTMVDVVRPGALSHSVLNSDRLARTCTFYVYGLGVFTLVISDPTGYLKSYETFKRRFEIPIVNGMVVRDHRCRVRQVLAPAPTRVCVQGSARTPPTMRCGMPDAALTC